MPLPPGPTESALVQTLLYLARPDGYLREAHRRHGDVFSFQTLLFGREVVVVRPADVKRVFTGDPDVLRAGEANAPLAPILGSRSVLLLDGPEHLRQRRLLMPPFVGERMRAYRDVMRELTEREVAGWPVGESFAVQPRMQRLTLDIIVRTIFGVGEGALADALSDLVERVSSPVATLGLLPPLRHEAFGLSPWAAFLRARRRTDELLYAEIRRRRAELDAGGAKRGDVLTMLLEARDEAGQPMTDAELRDELMTLLAAGHETTATMLAWTFDLVLRDARVLALLLDEAEAAEHGRLAEPDALPYHDAVIKEVLRLRPVVPSVGRRVKEPMTFGGFDVPAGAMMVPSAWITHRLPDLYPDPEAFKPERFLHVKPDPYAWFPFGGGVRRCLGMAFALVEMRIVLATVLRRATLRPARRDPAAVVVRSFTHAPRGGVPVVATPRTRRAHGSVDASSSTAGRLHS